MPSLNIGSVKRTLWTVIAWKQREEGADSLLTERTWVLVTINEYVDQLILETPVLKFFFFFLTGDKIFSWSLI